jgi:hypothetical protein
MIQTIDAKGTIRMVRAIELAIRTLCDSRPQSTLDAAYLSCQTLGNQHSVFPAAQSLISHGYASKILILKTQAKSGYPGYDHWHQELRNAGIADDKIVAVPIEKTPSLNTLIESRALVEYAKNRHLKTLAIVSSPFHQLRAFMTAVTVALRIFPKLSIYSHPGQTLPWCQEVAHSQGTLKAKRYDLIKEELRRIEIYQAKGDLASYNEVIDYLNQRRMVFESRIRTNRKGN